MCDNIDRRRVEDAKGAWNQWCEAERDRAPGDIIVDWLREATNVGVGVVGEYISAGLDLARKRAEVARAGRALLDDPQRGAAESVGAKRRCAEAIAADVDIIHRLEYYASSFAEEASFCSDAGARRVYLEQAEGYRELLRTLGRPPPAPSTTDAESDAMALLGLRATQAKVVDTLSQTLPSARALAPSVPPQAPAAGGGSWPSSAPAARGGGARLQDLVQQLFQLHDLDGDGLLAEDELIRLNEKVALLHRGEVDKGAVVARFQKVFRDKLDPGGRPVTFERFLDYKLGLLQELDPDPQSQEMMLEQFIAEARLARDSFRYPSFQSHHSWPSAIASDVDGVTPVAAASLPTVGGDSAELLPPTMDSGLTGPPPGQPPPPGGGSSAPAAREGHRERLLPGPPPRTGEASQLLAQGSSPAGALSLADKVAQMAAAPSLAERAGLSPGHGARGEALGSFLGDAGSSEPGPSGAPEAAAPAVVLWAAKGDKVQVWSNSKGGWLDAFVEEAFAQTCRSEGYTVPAGTLKVRSSAGVKWVRPGDEGAVLRRA